MLPRSVSAAGAGSWAQLKQHRENPSVQALFGETQENAKDLGTDLGSETHGEETVVAGSGERHSQVSRQPASNWPPSQPAASQPAASPAARNEGGD